jgi:polyhydroxyalkanoate synthesis regulator phasin
LETVFAWISNVLSIVTGNTPVTITNRGRKEDSSNPQNIADENTLLRSRLTQAENCNQELEARITQLEKQVQQLQGNSQ